MCTTRLWTRGVLAVGLIVLLSGYGLAAGQASSRSSDSTAATLQTAPTTMGEATLRRASRVMHAQIKGTDGKTLGRVHDLVLTPDLNSISYIALSTGGIAGIGGRLHAVPWSALSASIDHAYSVPVTKEQLKQTPGFHKGYWPSSPETGWTIQTTGTGKQAAYRGESKEESRVVQERRFSRIKGFTVRDDQGKHVGTIRDMVVTMDDGRVAYTVVSHGGLLGLGTRYTAVPESAIRIEPDRHMARVDVTPAVLQANSFKSNQWPALSDPAYSDQLARAFGVPTGTALGYVPPRTSAPAPTPPPASSTTPSLTPPATTAEPSATDLTGTFNPATVSAVEGTVVAAGKFKPPTGGPDMLWLLIRTDDGRTVLANLGPRSYISSQDFYVVRGDRIRLNGSDVTTASGRHVWLPTDVTYNNHVLRLRSATGTPLWEGQAASSTTSPGATTPETPSSRSSPTSGTTSTPGATSTTSTAGEPNEPNQP